MNKVKRRTLILFVLIGLLLLGSFSFLIKMESDGASWAAFASNDHTHHRGIFTSGQILDRDGTLLLTTNDDGYRVYHDDRTVRLATLHAVGDEKGNIGGSATASYKRQLMGYNMINGTYSLSGKGRNLYLTIDTDLNVVAWNALGSRSGCVAVVNYHSGEILCMVSSPAFDPSDPPADPGYLNRFLTGLYAPGSIFKLVTAEAAIENLDTANYHYSCGGSAEYEGGSITCMERHGDINFEQALAVSCNCAFADIAQQLGGETLAKYVGKAGLLSSQDINGFTTVAGSFDIAESALNLGWSAAGQYNDMINPAGMLAYVAAIANDGKAPNFQLIKKVTTTNGLLPTWLNTDKGTENVLSSKSADKLTEMMKNNVATNYSNSVSLPEFTAAKSGTAEVAGAAPHSWFTGFIDDPAHPYAFIVLVENGGAGKSVAGSVAAKVLSAALDQ